MLDIKKIPEMRKNSEILVIDDQEFLLTEPLRNYGYQITEKKDLNSLKDAAAYDIILCDIRGVGKFLQSKYEGANLIKELKLKYPQKKIVAYTAEEYTASFSELLDYADKKVEKGTSVDDWTSLLDEVVKDKYDLKKQWALTREALIKNDVPIRTIAKYESDYVNAIRKNSIEKMITLMGESTIKGTELMIELLKLTNSVLPLILN